MKKKIITLFLILVCGILISPFCFAKSNKETKQKKIKADIEFEVLDEDEVDESEFEEFEFPEEKVLVKNVIKADIGTAASSVTFEIFSLIPTDVVRLPLSWEIAFCPFATFQLEIESLSYFIMPAAMGISAGVSFYPLNKAPYDLFIGLRAGGAFGMFYAFTAQASLGWQFILKSNFVIALGADFAYYFSSADNQFYIPSVSLSLGWGF